MPARTPEALKRRKENAVKSARDRYRTDPRKREWHKNWGLLRFYGITKAEYDRMFAKQGGLCAVCRVRRCKPVDHDHRTKKVRALLCNRCNIALGFVEDKRLLAAALAYLKEHR